MEKSLYEKAIEYCEEYEIIEFQVKRKKLVYYRNYYSTYHGKKLTVKFEVNLETMETKRTYLRRLNRAGDWNML